MILSICMDYLLVRNARKTIFRVRTASVNRFSCNLRWSSSKVDKAISHHLRIGSPPIFIMHTTICIYIICARIGSLPIFTTGRHGDLLIANLSQGRSGQLLSRQSYGLWNDRPWWQKLERASSLLKNQTLCLDVSSGSLFKTQKLRNLIISAFGNFPIG